MGEFLRGPHDGVRIPPQITGALYVCVQPAGLDEYHLYLPDGEHFGYVGPCDGASGTPAEHPHWDIEAASS